MGERLGDGSALERVEEAEALRRAGRRRKHSGERGEAAAVRRAGRRRQRSGEGEGRTGRRRQR